MEWLFRCDTSRRTWTWVAFDPDTHILRERAAAEFTSLDACFCDAAKHGYMPAPFEEGFLPKDAQRLS